MTLAQFRKNLEVWWANNDELEIKEKNSQGALLAFIKLYEGFDLDERKLADQVIVDWISSANERKRFDALAMIDFFQIRTAIPYLRREEEVLDQKNSKEVYYELKKIRRILLNIEPKNNKS